MMIISNLRFLSRWLNQCAHGRSTLLAFERNGFWNEWCS